jgi:hypothetical protein
VVRKITVTAIVGAISFPLTDLIFDKTSQQLAMAAGVGSVVLLVQFLVDFEHRLLRVEREQVNSVTEIQLVVDRGFAKINDATQLFAQVESAGLHADTITKLVQRAVAIGPEVPRLVYAFAQSEIDRVSEFLRELADQQATYDGEDQEWLLGLTQNTIRSIDAISIPEVDAAGNAYHNFWETDLGRRYLDQQRNAVRRGVRVRRVFVTEHEQVVDDPTFQRVCSFQADLGIEVRLLHPSAIPHAIRNSLFDFILFDNTLSYEVIPAAHVEGKLSPMILHTRLILRQGKVRERIERYHNIWASALPWPDVDNRETASVPSVRGLSGGY